MTCRHRRNNQLSIAKTLVIPDNKPDIERVLRVTTTPEVMKTSIIKGKVIFTGELKIFVEYVACSPCNTQPIHFAPFKTSFAHFVDHRCAQPWQDAKIAAIIEFQELRVIDRRTINAFFIVKAVVVKLDGSRIMACAQPCSSQNVINISAEAAVPCHQPEYAVDCSVHQPCSCVTCHIGSS